MSCLLSQLQKSTTNYYAMHLCFYDFKTTYDWALQWTKRHWGRFSPSTSVSPANHHSTNFSINIITLAKYAYWRPQCRVDPIGLHLLHTYTQNPDQVGVAVTFIHGALLKSRSGHQLFWDFFVVLFSHCRQIPRGNINYTTTTFFRILCNLLLTNYPTIRRYNKQIG
jgi:hypothetical protein